MTESLSEGAAGDKDRQHVKKFGESQPISLNHPGSRRQLALKQIGQMKVRFFSPPGVNRNNHAQNSFNWSLPCLFFFQVISLLLADVPPLVTNGK